jgi:hypothetical protein
MERRIESVIFKGFINKNLTVSYIFNLKLDGKYRIIEEDDNGMIKMYPGYILQLNPGYPLPRVFISPRRYFPFVSLLEKTIKLIQENLFELFPSINKIEFEVDERMLARFQTEKALNSSNITMMPAVYTDSTNQCYPGIRVSLDDKEGAVTLPLEDAMGISQMLKTFDPNAYGLALMSQLIKIE